MNNKLKFDRRRAPDCERKFVNRAVEIQVIQDKLDAGIQGGNIRAGIVCFWGAFGLGKSWLLITQLLTIIELSKCTSTIGF